MNTSGPAFPVTSDNYANSESAGMTLRDYFAAKAMAEWVGVASPVAGAILAYEWADAMLKAREQ